MQKHKSRILAFSNLSKLGSVNASVISLAGCGADPAKTITVAASEDPHAVILNSDAVQNYVKDKIQADVKNNS